MYLVEVHSFNEGGHYHYSKYFDDGDYKSRMSYVEEQLKFFFKHGYSLDEVHAHPEIRNNMDNSFIRIAFLKKEESCESTAEVVIRKIHTNMEYVYEC